MTEIEIIKKPLHTIYSLKDLLLQLKSYNNYQYL